MRRALASLLLLTLASPLVAVAQAATRGDALALLLKPLQVEQVQPLKVHGGQAVSFELRGVPAAHPEAHYEKLRRALEHGGWRLLWRYPALPGQISATFSRRQERLTVSLARGQRGAVSGAVSGRLLVLTPPARAPRLPGACVKVPELRFEIMVHPRVDEGHGRRPGASPPRSIRWTFHTRFVHDLDGDGLLDALVPRSKGAHCPSSVTEEVYITRCTAGGCCGHRVGILGPGRIDVDRLRLARPGPGGLKPVELILERTEHRTRIPDRFTYTRRFAFSRGRYRLVRQRRTGGRCHHCSSPSCSGPIRLRACPLAWPERPGFAAIGTRMAQAVGLARACYRAPLKTSRGRLVSVSVEVAGQSGKVTRVGFYKHDPVPPRLQRCIRQALHQVRFAPFCEPSASFSGPLR